LLNAADEWAEQSPLAAGVEPPERFPRTEVDEEPCLDLDLSSCGIKTVVWATGYRPDYSWLDIPVLDRKGMIKHDGGVADSPGIYVLGMPFLRKRKSSFIHGAEDDARRVTRHLARFLGKGL
jgi:putative flavoprotein involved in K+ transport